MRKIVTVVGARPQFIKAATVSRAIMDHNRRNEGRKQIREVIVHTGQHFDANMSDVFFQELNIPAPDYNLGIHSAGHGAMTGRMLERIEEVLLSQKPDLVLVYGDTNSTLAGALAAAKLHIAVGHVEAGLRSFNRRMPEEINRIVADQLSQILFCPTETAVRNLQKEGFTCLLNDGCFMKEISLDSTAKLRADSSRVTGHASQVVINVGDVMYDLILYSRELADSRSHILMDLGFVKQSAADAIEKKKRKDVTDYCLVTVHRQENTDSPENLAGIFKSLTQIAAEGMLVVVPLHPRTRQRIKEMGLTAEFGLGPADEAGKYPSGGRPGEGDRRKGIMVIEPVGYLDMIQLENYASAVFTDSGGVQKEAFFLGVPCITLREETEWVETVDGGWNILTGADPDKITGAFLLASKWNGEGAPFKAAESISCTGTHYPYGDGKAAEKIVSIITDLLN